MMSKRTDDTMFQIAERPRAHRMAKSGYTHCACPNCFEVAVSSNMNEPELCSLCEEAGCDGHRDKGTPGRLSDGRRRD